jgi:diguanylate cyclase (GGDEF)-like protein/PAS domain S-box-containing protein
VEARQDVSGEEANRVRQLPQELRAQLAEAMESMGDAVELTDRAGRYLYVNPAFERLTGWSAREVIGRTPSEILRSPEEAPALFDAIWGELELGRPWTGLLHSRDRHGALLPCECTVTPILGSDGLLARTVCVRRPAHGATREQVSLQAAVNRYRMAVTAAESAAWAWDLHTGDLVCHPPWPAAPGEDESRFTSMGEWLERVHPEDRGEFEATFERHLRGDTVALDLEYRLQTEQGNYRVVRCRGAAERKSNGNVRIVAGDQRLAEIQARLPGEPRHTLLDPLTGLSNRATLDERLRLVFDPRRERRAGVVAVLFVDLDGLKTINDTLGHAAGDDVLRHAAIAMVRCIRGADCVARIGGDEFVVLVDGVRDERSVRLLAHRLSREIAAPVRTQEGAELSVGASIGIALARPGMSADAVVREADADMYRAKFDAARRRGRRLSNPRRDGDAQLGRTGLVAGAAERGELEAHFQPIVALRDRRVLAYEALVRWNEPGVGRRLPADILPAAARLGAAAGIDRWMLGAAARRLARWHGGDGDRALRVAVNLSGHTIGGDALVSDIERVLEATSLPPSALVLELTDNLFLADPEAAERNLRAVAALGPRLVLDNFGTGSPSLADLARFSIHGVKVDAQFVHGIGRVLAAEEIIRAVLALGRTLGIEVAAEGIETEEQLRWLADAGCTIGQGYLLGRPDAYA